MKNILRNDEAPQDLALTEDLEIPGEWLVEYSDDDGAHYLTIFARRQRRARETIATRSKRGGWERALWTPRWRGPNFGAE
jgi:hypothetical protein